MATATAPALVSDTYDLAIPAARAGVALTIVPHETWDSELSQFADASYDQTAAFAAAKRGSERVVTCQVHQRGTLIGGAVATRFALPGLRTGLYYVKFGPVWRRAGEAESWTTYTHVVRALRREFCDRRGSLLTIVPRPNPEFASREAEILEAEGFNRDLYAPDPNRYLVDLKGPLDAAAGFSQKWRYNLKRARKTGLKVVEHEVSEAYATFAELHRVMVERKRFQCDDAVEAVPQLADVLPRAMSPKIYLAYEGDRAVAGAVIGTHGDMACYLYGASSEGGAARNAGYLLQWHIIEQLRQGEQRWYDLGGEALDPGLRQFKRGLVGRQGEIFATPGEFSCWTSPVARMFGVATYAARSARLAMRSLPGRGK